MPRTPQDSPTPSSPPTAEASSGGSSTASSGGGLVADAGPIFDPAELDGAPAPAAVLDEPVDPDLWDVARVRSVLEAKGLVLHGLLAVDPSSTEWVYTAEDLSAIAPPLTRILNRYDATRAAAAAGDELAVAVGFGGYVIRSYGQRKAALTTLELAAARERQSTGAGADVELAPGALADAAAADELDIPDAPPLAPRVR